MHGPVDPGTPLLGMCPIDVSAQVHRRVSEDVHCSTVDNQWKTYAAVHQIWLNETAAHRMMEYHLECKRPK